MRHDKRNIFVTRSLSGRQIEFARTLGLEPVIEPALKFDFPEYWDDVLKVITEHPKSAWVFTSRNGVRALEKMMEGGLRLSPDTAVFAVGANTAAQLKELGISARVPGKQTGAGLAEFIVQNRAAESVIHFRGNLSRSEMKEKLEQEGINVADVEVYRTSVRSVHLPNVPVDAILFYSPSAVEAFRQGTGFDRDLPVLFAIGPTTAEALKKETGGEVHIPDKPDTELLLRTTANYLFNIDH